ncbi:glycosyltransferase [Plesiomonas shigelloides]|uniref:Glycosyl transferase group 1 protein n=2 Tax=Plesiomonas shigelloides TaxID=703 RepID=R8ASI6_PLESH|nr:glycosyltransferase [Plesiomonas shigelloides]AHF46351.1 glycosyl transferase group 1 [Plesiomonas shigelloides]EON89278.1 glycosyl transferase group 1 protein [Plesiomonas shigelloides 302-73]
MNIVFLGGIYLREDSLYVNENSIGVIQNAADVLQKNYMQGLIENCKDCDITLINVPFVGGYPTAFKKKYFKAEKNIEVRNNFTGDVIIKNCSFLNIKGIKHFFRFFVAAKEISKLNKSNDDLHIICYSMHLPFLLACWINKLLFKNISYYVVVPDLPEYMAERSVFSKKIHSAINKVSYWISNKSDGLSLITKHMAECFSGKVNKIIIEGISSKNQDSNLSMDKYPFDKFFLYTGTLDRRYGIKDLVDSYIKADFSDISLVICGDGNERKYVELASMENKNIIYLGQVSRTVGVSLQMKALALINPRPNSDAFTKYSFPSKIIEYMQSGRPVVMYRLDGIPSEYNGFYFEIEGVDCLTDMLKHVGSLSEESLGLMGERAKKFVESRCSPKQQVKKLVKIMRLSNQ